MRVNLIILVFLCCASITVHARPALRMPLNIIPVPMRDADTRTSTDIVEKVAPQVVAQQSGNATRSIAAIPGSRSRLVQVGQLGTLENAAIGVEKGYGVNLWTGGRAAYLIPLLRRLPHDIRLSILREIEITLLRSSANAPPDKPREMSWFAARLQRLLELGDAESVVELVARTGAARVDADVARITAQAHFALNDIDEACGLMSPDEDSQGFSRQERFFLKGRIYCFLQAGQNDAAALSLSLSRAKIEDDELFYELAFRLSSGVVPEIEARALRNIELTFLHHLMLSLGGVHLPSEVDAFPLVAQSARAIDSQLPAIEQLHAGARAIRAGLMNPNAFVQASLRVDLSAFEALPQSEAAIETGAQEVEIPPLVHLAFALRNLDAISEPAVRALHVADALAIAHEQGIWDFAVTCLLEDIRVLPIGSFLREYAAVFVPALLYARDFDHARQWIDLVMFDGEKTAITPYWDGLARVLPVLEAALPAPIDIELPGNVPAPFGILMRGFNPTPPPFSDNLARLSRLAQPNRLGDFLLNIQSLYGAERADEITLTDLAGIIYLFRDLGLETEARALATSVLVAHLASPFLTWWIEQIEAQNVARN